MKHAREVAGRHRAEVRPRYGRITVLGTSVAVTLIAVAGGFGMLPSGGERTVAATSLTSADRATDDTTSPGTQAPEDVSAAKVELEAGSPATEEPAADSARSATPLTSQKRAEPADPVGTALPASSGTGRRIVFSEIRQRVWLVDSANDVLRTYLASGSVYDNLDPGTYEVFSRSRWATGVDDSGTMEYFVRFTHGDAGAAIGFHTIPVDDGEPVQTLRELGTPLSHGCIRQKRSDAIALWDFAPIGTTVVVTT
ncbi:MULTISPECIES: L,D-transpeptidase [Nocardioides]|uniref:L,D-transpeptidase n=1 Tax=Nocardioides vastitatis TaxID=2568655 RepID=A0ABW0ZCY9_9ACTN|nr:L,D-transpeptidase [Nocardioides sp.]THJ12964.1 L,D-transpeptidase [Nocardioides sp.]